MLPDLYFFRDSKGNEVDLLMQSGRQLKAVEIKSAKTFSKAQLEGLRRFKQLADNLQTGILVYNGQSLSLSDSMKALNFRDIESTE